MSEQRKNINCRVCLRFDLRQSDIWSSIFDIHNNLGIAEQLNYVADINIKKGDGLPANICPDCLKQLEIAFEFKQKCESSNKILLSIIRKPSKECKITFKVPVKKELVVEDENDDVCGEYSDTEPDTIKSVISRNEESIIPQIETLVDSSQIIKKVVIKRHDSNENHNEHENVLQFNDLPVNHEKEENTNEVDKQQKIQAPENGTELIKKSKAKDLQLICDDCGGTFKSKCKLSVHWKKVHLHTRLICPKCKRTFKTFKALHVHKKKNIRSCYVATKVHIEGQGKDRLFHCPECPYHTKFIKDIDAHLTTHSGDRRYQCKDCFKCFTQHSSLQGHREAQHKDYRVEGTCHLCGKYLKGRSKLYKHMRSHRPKTVQCEICKKMFKSRPNLANHMKRHSGVRSYTCEMCSASFFTGAELCNHRRKVHFKSKSFKCDMCEYSAHTEGLLKTHRSRHTLDNVVCLMCGMFLDNEAKLAIHQRKHTEKKYCCPHSQCDKGFFLKDSLRRHMVKKHGLSDKQEKIKVLSIKQENAVNNKYCEIKPLAPFVSS